MPSLVGSEMCIRDSRQCHQKRGYRRKEGIKASQTDQKRHPLQKSPLYYLDRAGAAADLRPR